MGLFARKGRFPVVDLSLFNFFLGFIDILLDKIKSLILCQMLELNSLIYFRYEADTCKSKQFAAVDGQNTGTHSRRKETSIQSKLPLSF